MSKAVRFSEYGGLEVLTVEEVDRPVPGTGQVLVRVRAAGINPVEVGILSGFFAERWPATLPAGLGSDLAGVIEEVGEDVRGFVVGEEVLGFTHTFELTRGSFAEYVLVEATELVLKPAGVSWEAAGGLFIAGTAAYGSVRAVALRPGETVVVAGAAGGVGSLAVQLAREAGATVVGLASERHHAWLRAHGVIPVTYGPGVADRIRAATGGTVDAFIDTHGADYVNLALELGIAPDRINTTINFAAAAEHGVKAEANLQAATAEVMAELAGLVDKGLLDVPIEAVYPLDQVREAFEHLTRGHNRGKIVLVP
ncbi:NADPH:quinone reductase [Longispora fulva]|uniref:NADPH:quinone reductase-like Zn-dependent oxidoreductase n=1 Tax=Longispora fulva TaxID=619741 RepID=A0A8J7GHU3_9ACTN|nr:NADP-dependent oxidoreductase [Longispora fulva]MBG6139449.1 NADPH:quinone reductase-like Zn-dependent oxidoreductase [Longispora fulva]GIG58948.1 NADPH:quinone reductase [Longispora fulva]